MKKILFFILITVAFKANSQTTYTVDALKVKTIALIGATSSVPSAALAIISTTKGFLMPKLTTSQMNSIPSPSTGLQVFNTTVGAFYTYNGTVWENTTNIVTFGTITFSSTPNWDFATGMHKKLTVTGSATLSISNDNDGDFGRIFIFQDATGGRAFTLPGGDNTANVISPHTTANSIVEYYYIKVGSVRYWTSVNH